MEEKYVKGGAELPQFLFIHLPNDHMTKERPDDGYPYEESFMADNDYALGPDYRVPLGHEMVEGDGGLRHRGRRAGRRGPHRRAAHRADVRRAVDQARLRLARRTPAFPGC